MHTFDFNLHCHTWRPWIFITVHTDTTARETHPSATIATLLWCACCSKPMKQWKPTPALSNLSRHMLGYWSWKPHQSGNWNLQRFKWFLLRGVVSGPCYKFVTAVDVNPVSLLPLPFLPSHREAEYNTHLGVWFYWTGGARGRSVQCFLTKRYAVEVGAKMNLTELDLIWYINAWNWLQTVREFWLWKSSSFHVGSQNYTSQEEHFSMTAYRWNK